MYIQLTDICVLGNHTGIVDHRWRNDCGVAGEDCSLCMVSGIASAYWVRWMLVTDDPDEDLVHIARGAPRRWYGQSAEPFGITNAPTRFGKVRLGPSEPGTILALLESFVGCGCTGHVQYPAGWRQCPGLGGAYTDRWCESIFAACHGQVPVGGCDEATERGCDAGAICAQLWDFSQLIVTHA